MPDIVPPRAPSGGVNWALVTVWGARLAWLAVAVFGGRAVGAAAAARSDGVQVVATLGSWAGWAAGALALAVPGLLALTAVRAIVPASLVVAGVAFAAGADGGSTLALAIPAGVAAVLVGGADTGRMYVQASAYGDEHRFPLRPPFGYLAATVVSWALWVGAVVSAPLLWAARAWVIAVLATLLAVAASWLFPRRWHLLSRRWLVSVPAGLVVHDPVVLLETLMMPRAQVGAIGVIEERGSGALDLTGPTPGLALEIVLTETVTVVLAPRPATPKGTAIHLNALLVAPSRPGAVLREADRRRLPVR